MPHIKGWSTRQGTQLSSSVEEKKCEKNVGYFSLLKLASIEKIQSNQKLNQTLSFLLLFGTRTLVQSSSFTHCPTQQNITVTYIQRNKLKQHFVLKCFYLMTCLLHVKKHFVTETLRYCAKPIKLKAPLKERTRFRLRSLTEHGVRDHYSVSY